MTRVLRIVLAAAALLGGVVASAAGDQAPVYRHRLANFGGPIPFMGVRIEVDAAHDEAYVLEGNVLHVFAPSGMEIFTVQLDPGQGRYFDVAFDAAGEVFLLGVVPEIPGAAGFFLDRRDFRGRHKERIEPRALPAELAGFAPNHLAVHDDRFVLVSTAQLAAVVLGRTGVFERALDLAPLLDIKEEERGNLEIGGFSFDPRGNMLFTVPAHFRAYVVSPEGHVAAFGKGGSRPGQFGVVAGIAGDRKGHLYIADKLRAVVMVFDREGRFLAEVGGYGDRPGDLVGPDQLALGPSGLLYVTQIRQRGISVFEVVM